MSEKHKSEKKEGLVQAVQRAFFLLENLNLYNGTTAHALAKAVRLPRGTVHRLLETLRIQGYVEKDPHTLGYWVSNRAKNLSSGFSDQSWILEVGEKVVNRIHKKTKLSVVLTTPHNEEAEMVVRLATILRNPAGGHRTTAGTRVPMGQICSGQVYLAHCSQEVQAELLDKLFGGKDKKRDYGGFTHSNFALERAAAEKMLSFIRLQGYALDHLRHDLSGKVAVVAVQIIGPTAVIGTLSLNCYYSTLTPASLKENLIILKNAAAEIAAYTHARHQAP